MKSMTFLNQKLQTTQVSNRVRWAPIGKTNVAYRCPIILLVSLALIMSTSSLRISMDPAVLQPAAPPVHTPAARSADIGTATAVFKGNFCSMPLLEGAENDFKKLEPLRDVLKLLEGDDLFELTDDNDDLATEKVSSIAEKIKSGQIKIFRSQADALNYFFATFVERFNKVQTIYERLRGLHTAMEDWIQRINEDMKDLQPILKRHTEGLLNEDTEKLIAKAKADVAKIEASMTPKIVQTQDEAEGIVEELVEDILGEYTIEGEAYESATIARNDEGKIVITKENKMDTSEPMSDEEFLAGNIVNWKPYTKGKFSYNRIKWSNGKTYTKVLVPDDLISEEQSNNLAELLEIYLNNLYVKEVVDEKKLIEALESLHAKIHNACEAMHQSLLNLEYADDEAIQWTAAEKLGMHKWTLSLAVHMARVYPKMRPVCPSGELRKDMIVEVTSVDANAGQQRKRRLLKFKKGDKMWETEDAFDIKGCPVKGENLADFPAAEISGPAKVTLQECLDRYIVPALSSLHSPDTDDDKSKYLKEMLKPGANRENKMITFAISITLSATVDAGVAAGIGLSGGLYMSFKKGSLPEFGYLASVAGSTGLTTHAGFAAGVSVGFTTLSGALKEASQYSVSLDVGVGAIVGASVSTEVIFRDSAVKEIVCAATDKDSEAFMNELVVQCASPPHEGLGLSKSLPGCILGFTISFGLNFDLGLSFGADVGLSFNKEIVSKSGKLWGGSEAGAATNTQLKKAMAEERSLCPALGAIDAAAANTCA